MRVDATDIGMANAAAIAASALEAIRGGDAVLDLSAVRTCDSSAVAVVLACVREAQTRGGRLQLIGLPAGLVSLASVYGVAPLLSLDTTGN